MAFSFQVYRLLLKCYPARFREEYAAPLERQFRDEYGEAASSADRARFWARTLADLAVTVPSQIAVEVLQDTRHTMRLWVRRPAPIALAVAALAIGIGANTGVFSVLNAVLLRSLPFREPGRIAELWMFAPVGLGGSPAAFQEWRTRSTYLEDAARFGSLDVNLAGARDSARIRLTETSANFFSMLGTPPILGRAFADGEDTAGKDAIAVIGYGLWQQLFGGDARVLGATIYANGTPLTIVGVAPPRFDYPAKTAVWTPTTFDFQRIPKTGVYFIEHIGRLQAGLTWRQASDAFQAEASRSMPRRPHASAAERPALRPLEDQLAGPVKQATLVLMGGVGLILLIACVNVAHLLLARAIDRSHELLIRASIGAGPARLSQQLLTESLLLALVAAAGGLLVAYWTAALAAGVQPAPLASQVYSVLDARVLGFAAGLALLTGLIFGVFPAVHAGRLRVSAATLRGIALTPRAGKLRRLLVAVQVALAIVLLAASVGMGRAFLTMLRSDTGYRAASLVTLNVSLAGTTHAETERARRYAQEVLRRVREVPGVQSATWAEFFPLTTSAFMGGMFRIDHLGTPVLAKTLLVGPGYFHTMGGRILAGREFEEADAGGSQRLAIVSDEFAHRFGDPASVLGRSVTAEAGYSPARIIGVAHGMWYGGPSQGAGDQIFLLAHSSNLFTIAAQVSGAPRGRMAAIQAAAQSLDPKVPVFDVKTMQQRVDDALARPRFYTTTALFFGGFALLLAVIGILGMVSQAVAQRTHEIGIRLALGATAGRVRGVLVRQGVFTALGGAVPGVAGALAVNRFLENLLPGAGSLDGATCAIVIGSVCALSAAATWSATHRIARLDLADVLRAE